MNQPRVYMCPSILNPSSHIRLPPYSSGLSQSMDFECPASCIKLALVIWLCMVMYMFQCCSLKSSHPCLLPLSPKVCVLHLCLLCCPACRIVITIFLKSISSVQFSSVARSYPTLQPHELHMPGLPVHHQLLEFTQTHVHWVGDAIQPSHPLSSPSPPSPNPSHHQSLFQWVNSLHEVAKVLEFQPQHQSFQRTPRTDLL